MTSLHEGKAMDFSSCLFYVLRSCGLKSIPNAAENMILQFNVYKNEAKGIVKN